MLRPLDTSIESENIMQIFMITKKDFLLKQIPLIVVAKYIDSIQKKKKNEIALKT